MSHTKNTVRKRIYIVILGALLIPLSMVSRPSTRDSENSIKDSGGVLSQIRNQNNLSPAKLSEIDPGSETMKLASLGLRGIAVNLLWMKAIEAKDKKEWDVFSSTLNSLVKIQPNFIKVWEFQGHNLSYNVSVEFDDYEQRYQWIKKGIEFLTTGIPYNRRDHRIVDTLGFFSGNKFGTADERIQYRRLFRNDHLFHDEMSKFVNIDEINTPYDPDHWLLAYQWYDRSQNMVEQGVEGSPVRQYKKDMIYYQLKPAQLRNMGLSLQTEFRSDEYAKSNWQRAHKEWLEYGNRPIKAAIGEGASIDLTMEGLMNYMRKVEQLRGQLDKLAPGARKRLTAKIVEALAPEDAELMTATIDSLSDEQLARLRDLEKAILERNKDLEFQIAQSASEKDRKEAERISNEIYRQLINIQLADRFRNTINYEHWKTQTLVESSDRGLAARQALYDATELRRRSIFDEYVERDPISGVESRLPGAIQKYDEAFAIWAELFEEYPVLRQNAMMDDIVDVIKRYVDVRQLAGRQPWPDNFSLQSVIDYRTTLANVYDDLPTSQDLSDSLDVRAKERNYRMPPRPTIEFRLDENSGDGNTDE